MGLILAQFHIHMCIHVWTLPKTPTKGEKCLYYFTVFFFTEEKRQHPQGTSVLSEMVMKGHACCYILVCNVLFVYSLISLSFLFNKISVKNSTSVSSSSPSSSGHMYKSLCMPLFHFRTFCLFLFVVFPHFTLSRKDCVISSYPVKCCHFTHCSGNEMHE